MVNHTNLNHYCLIHQNYLMYHQPELGITSPYELNQAQYDAALDLLRGQRKLVARYWHDAFIQIDDFKNEGMAVSGSWPFQVQLLQADAPGTWNLKMPSHALWIPTLLKIYPDARLVWMHRDPLTALGSFCSIISLAQQGFTSGADPEFIGRNCSWQARQHADRIMDARDKLGEDRIIDVHYAQLTHHPIETMRRLYRALGDDFTAEAESGMRSWLEDNPQDKFGKHEYKLAQFGLDVDQ